jgi:mono/diheme cytochrome c family protein
MRLAMCAAALTLLILVTTLARADEPSLALTLDDVTHRFTTSELLARPDADDVLIPDDVDYHRATVYRAVPLLSLLSGLMQSRFDTLEFHATDGFVAHIPWSLVQEAAAGGATAWIAIEPPERPWPVLPGMSVGAGPFYLVWEHPERSGVSREQWPYQLASVAAVARPVDRWPQLAIDASLQADASAQRGQEVFITNCLPCHRLNGAGWSEVGPDLGTPMNVMEYMTELGLRAIVRAPGSVRTWPLQRMPGFGPEALSEADLDALLDYMRQIADRGSMISGQR